MTNQDLLVFPIHTPTRRLLCEWGADQASWGLTSYRVSPPLHSHSFPVPLLWGFHRYALIGPSRSLPMTSRFIQQYPSPSHSFSFTFCFPPSFKPFLLFCDCSSLGCWNKFNEFVSPRLDCRRVTPAIEATSSAAHFVANSRRTF